MENGYTLPITKTQGHLLMAVLRASWEHAKPVATSADDPIINGIAQLYNDVARRMGHPEKLPVVDSVIL
jgi:hypothetical protein